MKNVIARVLAVRLAAVNEKLIAAWRLPEAGAEPSDLGAPGLHEVLDDDTPDVAESILYLGIGSDMHLWEQCRNLLVEAKLITISGHRAAITKAGRARAIEIRKMIKERKK